MTMSLEIMKRLLRPVTADEMAAVVRRRVGDTSCEMLTLADAGVEEEVREIFEQKTDSVAIQNRSTILE